MARSKSQTADVSEIFEIKVRPSSSPLDAIDEYLKKLAQQEFLEAQLAKIRQIRARAELEAKKAEQELKRMEAEEEEGEEVPRKGKSTVTPEEVQVAQMLAQMPEEQRAEVIRYLALIKSLEARNPSASAMAMAILLSGLQQQRQNNDSEGWRIATSLIDKLLDMVNKSQSQPQQGSNIAENLAMEYINTLKQIVTKKPDPTEEVKKWLSFMETLQKYGMGMFMPYQVDPNVLIKLKALEIKERMAKEKLRLKKMELKLRQRELREREKLRKAMLRNVASTIIRELLSPEEEELPSGSEGAPQGMPASGYLRIRCPKCGTENIVPETAEYMTCVGCGTRYRIRKIPKGQAPSQQAQVQTQSQVQQVGGGNEEEGSASEAGHGVRVRGYGGGAQVVSY